MNTNEIARQITDRWFTYLRQHIQPPQSVQEKSFLSHLERNGTVAFLYESRDLLVCRHALQFVKTGTYVRCKIKQWKSFLCKDFMTKQKQKKVVLLKIRLFDDYYIGLKMTFLFG